MKIILSGCTGYIGVEILEQSLAHSQITSVMAISRRDLPFHEKLTTVILEDFASYPESVLDDLKGADACIWAIGTYHGSIPVDVEYPLAFANAMLTTVSDRTKPFHYVHLGGAFTEMDQEKNLWFLKNGRQVRGLAESNMIDFEAKHSTIWKSYIAKPAGVVPKNVPGSVHWLLGTSMSIGLSELASALIDIAIQGHDSQIISNAALVTKGRALMI